MAVNDRIHGEVRRMEVRKTGFLYKLWNILMPLVIYYAVYMISFFLLSCLYQVVAAKSGAAVVALLQEQKTTLTGIVNGASMLIGAMVLVPLLRVELQVHRDRMPPYGRQDTFGQGVGMILLTTVLAGSSSIGLNILLTLTGFVQSSSGYQEVAQTQYGVAFGAGVVLYAVVSPVAEEIVFRGIIYNRMRRYLMEWQDQGTGQRVGNKLPRIQQVRLMKRRGNGDFDTAVTVAVIASGVLFGAYHGNLIQGVYGGCMGILMAYLYERTHAFYIPCLFHAAANCVVYVVAQNAILHERIFTYPGCMALLAVSLVMILIVEKVLR